MNEKQAQPQLTSEQHRILLVGNWLKRLAAIMPMYGKTLEVDYPERFDEFLEEFRDADPARLDEAFQKARGACTEFPTPADIRRIYETLPVSQDQRETNYQRLIERIESQPKYLPASVLDDQAKPKPREVRQLSDGELQTRLDQLLAQRKQLLKP